MTDSNFSIVSTSEFVSFTLQTLLVGIFVVIYGIASCIPLIRGRTRWSMAPFIISTIMLLLALGHLGIDVHRCYMGFVVYGGTHHGTASYLADTRSPVFIAKSVLYVTQTLLGDAFMAYRVYILWSSSWAVAIGPILLICATAVTGYTSCYLLGEHAEGKDLLTMKASYSPWLFAFFSVAASYTVVTTALVAIRIYRWKRRARRFNLNVPISRWRVLETFIHSAAIYPVFLISLFITYVLGINPEMFGVDLLPALIGIASTIIAIRLGIVDVTEESRRTKAVDVSIRRMDASTRMVQGGQYVIRRPPPAKTPTLEPYEDSKENLKDIRSPTRSSTASAFGRDLLLAVQHALEVDDILPT